MGLKDLNRNRRNSESNSVYVESLYRSIPFTLNKKSFGRFMLFAFNKYVPTGGMGDLKLVFNNEAELLSSLENIIDESLLDNGSFIILDCNYNAEMKFDSKKFSKDDCISTIVLVFRELVNRVRNYETPSPPEDDGNLIGDSDVFGIKKLTKEEVKRLEDYSESEISTASKELLDSIDSKLEDLALKRIELESIMSEQAELEEKIRIGKEKNEELSNSIPSMNESNKSIATHNKVPRNKIVRAIFDRSKNNINLAPNLTATSIQSPIVESPVVSITSVDSPSVDSPSIESPIITDVNLSSPSNSEPSDSEDEVSDAVVKENINEKVEEVPSIEQPSDIEVLEESIEENVSEEVIEQSPNMEEQPPKMEEQLGEVIESQSVNEEKVNEEEVNEQSVNEQSVNEESVNEEKVNEQSVNEQSVNEQSVNEQSVNEQLVNEQSDETGMDNQLNKNSYDLAKLLEVYKPISLSHKVEQKEVIKRLLKLCNLNIDETEVKDEVINKFLTNIYNNFVKCLSEDLSLNRVYFIGLRVKNMSEWLMNGLDFNEITENNSEYVSYLSELIILASYGVSLISIKELHNKLIEKFDILELDMCAQSKFKKINDYANKNAMINPSIVEGMFDVKVDVEVTDLESREKELINSDKSNFQESSLFELKEKSISESVDNTIPSNQTSYDDDRDRWLEEKMKPMNDRLDEIYSMMSKLLSDKKV